MIEMIDMSVLSQNLFNFTTRCKSLNFDRDHNLSLSQIDSYGTFRQFRKEAGSFGNYQKRLFLLMGGYWITASFFLILPFYFFKRPQYCQQPYQEDGTCNKCLHECIQALCKAHPFDIANYIVQQNTLTQRFELYCDSEPWRIFYKICPEALSWIGLLIYGSIADDKGRKVAFKISWRFYTIGLVFFTATETQFLLSFGYFIACVNCFPSLVIQFILLFQQIDRSYRLKACYLLLSFLLIAPLLASFLAGYLVLIGFKTCLLLLCTIPAIILSLAMSWLQQSSIFTYKQNKILAFSIINSIAKVNKIPPITIDLTRSTWLKYDHYKISIWDALRHKKTRSKLWTSMLLMLTFFFNNRFAQISLDEFTDEYLRGTLMNGTSAIATISVIIFITRYKINKYTPLAFLSFFVTFIDLLVTLSQMNGFIMESILCISLRYLSDLSYSIFLIWTIQTFPTVCRAQCLTLALCFSSMGSILAYSLSSFPIIQLIISMILNLLVLNFSRFLQLDYENKLMDTLTDEYYDQNDKFKRV